MATTEDAAPLAAGTQLDGYVIERLIGSGSNGFSYLAQDAAQRECLIREFLPQEFAERDGLTVRARDSDDRNPLRFWLRAFLERSTQVSRLVNPALPRVLRQFEANGSAYEVSEYDPGETLQALLDTDGTLAEAQLLRILGGVLGALEAAHSVGLLHRDLCPQNIWLRDSDGTPRLQEFAVLRAPMRLKSRMVMVGGTPPYAAPEAESATGVQTAATDIYALGVIAYRALTGMLPPSALERRQGATVPRLATAARVRCSVEIAQAVEWAMELAPNQRPQSVAVWREALQTEAAADLTDLPPPRAAQRGPTRFALPVIAVLVIALLGYLLVPKGGVSPLVAAPAAPAPAALSPPPSSAASPAVAQTAAPSSAPAPDAATPAPVAAADGEPVSSLDRLALELIARERKLQDARDAQRTQIDKDKAAAEAKARETPPSKAAASSAPATVIAPPAAPSQATLDAEARTRALEQEVARLRAESEARRHAEDDAAKTRALAIAERELASQNAEAERAQQAKAIALARKTCPLPAMDLSEARNLSYYNALSAPGAYKTTGGAIRLPPVEISDGTTVVYEITPDSCAHRVR